MIVNHFKSSYFPPKFFAIFTHPVPKGRKGEPAVRTNVGICFLYSMIHPCFIHVHCVESSKTHLKKEQVTPMNEHLKIR